MTQTPEITLLLDGGCALCAREGRFIQRLDKGRGRVGFVDIAAAGFDPERFGRTREQVMAQIHGVLADGTVITGVEVFRRAYRAVGKGWLIGWTAWWPFRPAVDLCYRWFARHRLRISSIAARVMGQPPPCPDGACAVPTAKAR